MTATAKGGASLGGDHADGNAVSDKGADWALGTPNARASSPGKTEAKSGASVTRLVDVLWRVGRAERQRPRGVELKATEVCSIDRRGATEGTPSPLVFRR